MTQTKGTELHVYSFLLFLSSDLAIKLNQQYFENDLFPGETRGGEGVGDHVLLYMGYIGTCRRIGYGFRGSRSLNRVFFFF